LCYGSKVTATFITIKQATKQLQNEWQATWVTPLVGLINCGVSELLEYGRKWGFISSVVYFLLTTE
jgi:hypothetical protein